MFWRMIFQSFCRCLDAAQLYNDEEKGLKTMKKYLAALLACVLALSLAACGGQTEDSAGEAADSEEEKDFICIVSESSQGAPFSEQTWLGFTNVQADYGCDIRFVEALEASEYETQLRTMAETGADMIFSMFDAVNLVAAEIAPEYPDVRFVLIDCNTEFDIDNVTSIVVDSWEPSFVAGVVAALTTETGTVGWVGCLDIPVITRFYEGYAAGVDYANQTYGLNVQTEMTYVGSSEDTVAAAECTKMLADRGCDIIYQSANEAGLGVIQSCAELGVKCIGVDKWQGDVDPCVFWSALVCIEQGVYDTYEMYHDGTLEGGSITFGIANGFPIYADVDYEALPDNVKEAVDAVMDGVREGTLDVFAYGG